MEGGRAGGGGGGVKVEFSAKVGCIMALTGYFKVFEANTANSKPGCVVAAACSFRPLLLNHLLQSTYGCGVLLGGSGLHIPPGLLLSESQPPSVCLSV